MGFRFQVSGWETQQLIVKNAMKLWKKISGRILPLGVRGERWANWRNNDGVTERKSEKTMWRICEFKSDEKEQKMLNQFISKIKIDKIAKN